VQFPDPKFMTPWINTQVQKRKDKDALREKQFKGSYLTSFTQKEQPSSKADFDVSNKLALLGANLHNSAKTGILQKSTSEPPSDVATQLSVLGAKMHNSYKINSTVEKKYYIGFYMNLIKF